MEKDQLETPPKSKWLILVLAIFVLLGLIIGGIWGYRRFFAHQPNESQISEAGEKLQLKFLRESEVGKGFWPNIIFANDRLYISYEDRGSVSVNVYDQNLIQQKTYQLTSNEDADHRLVYGNDYFYLVNPNWIRKFDTEFHELKRVPQTKDIPAEAKKDVKADGGFGDQLLAFADNTLFLGKRYSSDAENKDKEAKKSSGPDNLYILEYDENLELKKAKDLSEIGHMAMNLIVQDGNIYIINADKKWDDSSLVALRFDREWNLLEKKTISAEKGANEEFASGTLYKDGYWYISYMRITGVITQPSPGNDFMRVDCLLKIFDTEWNLIEEVDISEIPKGEETGHNGRPGLVIAADKVFVVFDREEKTEGSKVFLKEYQIEHK